MTTRVALSLVVATIAVTPLAMAVPPICPPALSVMQSATPPSEGWVVSYGSLPTRLCGAGFFVGPPQDRYELHPDEQTRGRDLWVFNPPADNIWVKCQYEGTRAEVSRKLRAGVKRCWVSFQSNVTFASGQPALEVVACEWNDAPGSSEQPNPTADGR